MAPESLPVWIQRAGRAGRRHDIQAEAILLIQPTVFAEKGKKTRKEGEQITYVKKIDSGLRQWVEPTPKGRCRREVADEYFNNPPGRASELFCKSMDQCDDKWSLAPTGACCDNCTAQEAEEAMREGESSASAGKVPSFNLPPFARPSSVSQMDSTALPAREMDHFDASNWRAFVLKVRHSEKDMEHVTKLLVQWRRRTWWSLYSTSPFGPAGILPDSIIKTLSIHTTFASVDHLKRLDWLFAARHGPEVIAILALVDMPAALDELAKKKQKQEDAVATAAAKLSLERERAERTRERERAHVQKLAEAAQRKQRVEEARHMREEKQAAQAEARAEKAAAKAAARMLEGRGQKRQASGESTSASSKRRRMEKENEAPMAVEARVGPALALALTTPRPRPRPRPVYRPPTTSSITENTVLTAPLEYCSSMVPMIPPTDIIPQTPNHLNCDTLPSEASIPQTPPSHVTPVQYTPYGTDTQIFTPYTPSRLCNYALPLSFASSSTYTHPYSVSDSPSGSPLSHTVSTPLRSLRAFHWGHWAV